MSKLEGKVAWISGATSGIGETTARLFAREGAQVALVGRRLALGRLIAAELKADGGEALPLVCDVSKESQVRDSIRRTVARLGVWTSSSTMRAWSTSRRFINTPSGSGTA